MVQRVSDEAGRFVGREPNPAVGYYNGCNLSADLFGGRDLWLGPDLQHEPNLWQPRHVLGDMRRHPDVSHKSAHMLRELHVQSPYLRPLGYLYRADLLRYMRAGDLSDRVDRC